MPQDYEFTDYEPVSRGKGSRKTRAPQLYEDWPTAKLREFGADGSDSKDKDELSRVNEAEHPAKVESRGAVPKKGLLARGHGVTYIGLFLFTVVLFFRPYELIPALSGVTSLAFWIGVVTIAIFIPLQLALEGSITARPKEVTLVLLLTALALLSIPLAISPGEAWQTFGDTFIRAVLIFIVIINVVRTEKRLYGLIMLSLAVSVMLSVGAIGDFRAGNFAQQGRRILGVVGGMFGNPNDLALHLSTMVPLLIAFLLSVRSILVKVALALCAVFFVGAIMATFSRAGFLALITAGLVLAWKLGRRQRFITMTIVALAGVAFIAFAPGGYGQRILSIFGLAADPLGSAAARQTVLTHSIYTALRHPLGIGMGNYHILSMREAVSHNAYTQVAAELGLVALACYVWFLISAVKRLNRIERSALADLEQSKHAKRFYCLAVGLQGSMAAYMVGSFFASVAYQWYVYYLVGYAICLGNIYANWRALNPSLTKEVGTEIDAPSPAS